MLRNPPISTACALMRAIPYGTGSAGSGYVPHLQWTLLWLVAAACAQPHRVVPPASAPDSRPDPMASDSGLRARPRSLNIYEPGQLVYEYRTHAVIQSIAGDSIPRLDSTRIQATVFATFSNDQETGKRAEVFTDSVVVTTAGLNTAPQTASFPPQRYLIEIDPRSGQIRRERDRTSVCTVDSVTPLFVGDEVIPMIPATALTARAWVDTTRYHICRGGIQLDVTRIARYQVIAEPTTPPTGTEKLASIIRTSDISLKGQGLQWEQRVQASGAGTSSDTLAVALDPARLQSVASHARLEIEFQSDTRRQRFVQRSETQINSRVRH